MTIAKFMTAAVLAASMWSGTASAAVLIHHYELNGDLTDVYGGPSLVSLGGSLTSTPGRYDFGVNQGLRLTSGLNDIGIWSLDFKASYASLSGTWKKLVDFRNLTTDDGLYFANDKLQFYPDATGTTAVTTNTDYTIALTRDGSGTLSGYVNGLLQWAIANESESNVIGNVLTFFTDDVSTGQREAQPGSVDFIRIYDGVLTAGDVAILDQGGTVGAPATSVSEPGGLALLSAGLFALGWGGRKRKNDQAA
ncbi:MAG: hypothetical protein CVU19_02635 [Betaproteobacteria bacterium HGW-Betaproteobacteria-13]|nr:MAG: hypothetical protein CVU19_02635 [Betaproteobacteria bacterium HGW-Betaproteobacteria-13]